MVGCGMILCGSMLGLAATAASSSTPTGDHCSSSFLSKSVSIPNHAKVLKVLASQVSNFNLSTVGSAGTTSFCNVTVTYTHPGWNDTININVLLPETNWNGRFQGVGGGGWAANSGPLSLVAGVAQNYSTGNTDSGHSDNITSSAGWARKSNGQLNIPLLDDFASISLDELAAVGKQLSHRYYGYGPAYSYWNGCSTGGRQGLMLAQRYPTAFNGIFAGSPAAHFESLSVAQYWGQFLMNQLDYYPPTCVFDYVTAAAVKACDSLDGVIDGVISALNRCHFDPHTLIGSIANCTGGHVTITAQDADLVQEVWQGPRAPDGNFLWWGLNPGSPFEGLVDTICTNLTNCVGAPFGLSPDWISTWVLNETSFNFDTLTLKEYSSLFSTAYSKYHRLIGTEAPDLEAFSAIGGKMVTWHGLADPLIYPNGTISYYQDVESRTPDVRDFYRFFLAPGVGHCEGGAGEIPIDPLAAVVNWVENQTAPDTLPAVSTDGTRTRNLCQFPLVSVFKGGNPASASSFACETNW